MCGQPAPTERCASLPTTMRLPRVVSRCSLTSRPWLMSPRWRVTYPLMSLRARTSRLRPVRKLMNESHIRNVIEAALLAAGKPLQAAELVELFDEGARPQLQDIQAALTALMAEYSNRGIEIKET